MADSDPFDRQLTERLHAAEGRIEASSTAPALQTGSDGLRWTLLISTAAIAVVIAAAVVGWLPSHLIGEASPSPSGRAYAEARDGDITLTLSSPRSQWTTADDITISASVIGTDQDAAIWGGGGPIEFSIRQVEGGNAQLLGGQTLPCIKYPVPPGHPLVRNFVKFADSDKPPPFDLAWAQDPELHLPAGKWEVSAKLEYGIGGCVPPRHLDVTIELIVIEASTSPTAATQQATPTPSNERGAPERADSFGADGSIEHVSDLLSWGDGYVAVGTQYNAETMPNFGPPPGHEGRIWTSLDGQRWADETPSTSFVDRELDYVFQSSDGSLVAIGHDWSDDFNRITNYIWQSFDGDVWQPRELVGLPTDHRILGVAASVKGIVAAVESDRPFEPSLWHSDDGISWVKTHEPDGAYPESEFTLRDIGAGPEGFVVLIQSSLTTDPSQPTVKWHVLASRDGVSWDEASAPADASRLTAIGGHWILLARRQGTETSPNGRIVVWRSANGLDWSRTGQLELGETTPIGCLEYPDVLTSTGDQLILSTELGYPCSEGGFVRHGETYTANASQPDRWTVLGMPYSAQVAAVASATDSTVILGVNNGTESARAEFWILNTP